MKWKMKPILKPIAFWASALFFLLACAPEEKSKLVESDSQTEEIRLANLKSIPVKTLEFEAALNRHVSALLKIPPTEDFDFQVHYAFLDRDTLLDAVVLVNRAAYAQEKAKKENNEDFFRYLGYSGPHNHVFVYQGQSGKVLETVPVGSTVFHPLKISFDYVSTPTHLDFWVDYRIRNGKYRNYYTVRGDKLYLTFNAPIFDEIGEPFPKAYYHKLVESPIRTAFDIAVYHAEIKGYNPEKIEDFNNFTPEEILPKDELYVYFIFDEATKKYKTPMRPSSEEEE